MRCMWSMAGFVACAVGMAWAPLAAAQCPPAGNTTVKINELLPNPPSTDGGKEWIELHNSSGSAVSLSGWKIQTLGSGTSWTSPYTFDTGATIPANGFAVVTDAGLTFPCESTSCAFAVFHDGGNLSLPNGSNGDGVRIINGSAAVVDTVVYSSGSGNTDNIPDDCANPATSIATMPGEAQSLGRAANGVDTHLSAADFVTFATPTPGASNVAAPGNCAQANTGSHIVINEFLADQPGNETQNLEWIEIYNGSGAAIDLAGWTVRYSGSAAFTVKHTFTTQVIPNRGYLLLGESAANPGGVTFVQSGTLALGSGSGGDAIKLFDCADHLVDTVVYGGANDPGFTDDTGAVATSFAPTPGDGGVLQRKSDGLDTQQSGADFQIASTPTPGAANPAPAQCTPDNGLVTINEFLVDPAGTDSTVLLEWIELYNAAASSSAPISLEGWSIQFASTGDPGSPSRGYSTKATFPDGEVIVGRGFFVVGEPNVPNADFKTAGPLALGSGSNGDGIRLVDCAGKVVDTVVYGDTNSQGVYDDTGAVATNWAVKPGSGQTLARRVDGVDTDRSADDFTISDGSTRGAANPIPPTCVRDTGEVVINEFLANPAGSDTDVLLEWVEIFNRSSTSALTLDAWTIGVATSTATYSTKVTFPANTVIGPRGYLLVGEANVPGAHVFATGALGLGSGSGGDGVRLTDCGGTPVDTVVYGDASNEQGIVDDSGNPATSLAGSPGDNASIARNQDGLDTDRSGDDFTVSSRPTPGAANPTLVCNPAQGITINEFLPDPDGSDGEALREWVELYNDSDEDVALDGWGIAALGKPDETTIDVILPPGTSIAARDFLVVGAENEPEVDVIVTFSLGNATGGDSIELIDCDGELQDAVVYGADNDDGMEWEDGVGDPAPKPGSDQSLARHEEGVDTDAAGDWVVDGSPSPGESNLQEPVVCTTCEGGGGGCGGGQPGGGCGGGAPGDGEPAPGEGCSTSRPAPGTSALLLGLVAAGLRRRRRAA